MYVFVKFCLRYIGGKNSKEYLHCTCGRGHNAYVDLKGVPHGYDTEGVVSRGLTEERDGWGHVAGLISSPAAPVHSLWLSATD